MFENIPGHDKWLIIEKIDRGWSDDLKYFIETIDHQKLILRTSNIQNYEVKKKEYEVIQKYAKLGFSMSLPVDFGVSTPDSIVYMLLTYVDGEDLETALPKLSEEKQYQIGREAGEILKKIHSIPIPIEELPKTSKVAKKLAQIERYEKSLVRIKNDERALQYIKDNIHKIWSKNPVYQHGDFHPGNLILTKDQKIGVIDFNRWEIGDPYEEFYKLESFATSISIPYSIGQIDGYFQDDIPNDFWEILSVYVAHAALYSIHWAEKFGEADILNMTQICIKSFEHFNNFETCIPNWYKK
jgi:aminoglycoside phosphotransferase (APT) family kinase protein